MHQNEKVEDDLDLDGDDGLKNTWGLYYKNVGNGNEYVTSFITNTKRDLFNAEHHKVSPSSVLFVQRLLQTLRRRLMLIRRKHSQNCLPLA